MDNDFPKIEGTNTAWICAKGDYLCAGKSKGALNYTGTQFGMTGHGGYNTHELAYQVLVDLGSSYDHGAWGWKPYPHSR